jgi:hypothetical protein
MQLREAIPAVWVYTTANAFNRMVGDGPGFLTKDEAARLERIRQARLLYAGGESHRKYFVEEQRTQFNFPEIRAFNRTLNLFVPLNVLKLISRTWAKLLFGQEPIIRVNDLGAQQQLSEFIEQSNLNSVLLEAARECSYEAEAFLEICRKTDGVYVRAMDAAEIFPQGTLGADRQYSAYIRRQVQQIAGNDLNPVYALLETTYAAGTIERHVYQLDEQGKKRLELTLENWPNRPIDEPFEPLTKTGIDMPTIVWVPNELDHGRPVSDYDGLIELQDALNEANTRMKRVLHKHGDPKLKVPRNAADDRGNFPADADVLFEDGDGSEYGYLTWDAQLDAAQKDKGFTLSTLLINAEISPVLLGLKEGASPDAYRKVRIEAMNTLTAAGGKATLWKPAVQRMLLIAQAMFGATPGRLAYTPQRPAIQMRDGIGVDEKDQADTISVLRACESMSQRRSLEIQLDGNEVAVNKEMKELKDEQAAKLPTVFGGPSPFDQQRQQTPGNESAPAENPKTEDTLQGSVAA